VTSRKKISWDLQGCARSAGAWGQLTTLAFYVWLFRDAAVLRSSTLLISFITIKSMEKNREKKFGKKCLVQCSQKKLQLESGFSSFFKDFIESRKQ
jgi:hypothetical protein